jgi:hypothetical protein
VNDAIKLCEENLPQPRPADGPVLGDGIVLPHHLAFEGKQHLHVFRHEVDRAPRLAAGAVEQVEEMRRQAGAERAAAGRIDVAVALVDRGADAGLLQSLGHAQPADATADDEDVEGSDRYVECSGAEGRGHHTTPA